MALLSMLALRPTGHKRLLTVLVLLAALTLMSAPTQQGVVIDIDTAYSRAVVQDSAGIRTLYIGGATNSAMSLAEPDKLVYDYSRVYDLARHFMPNITSGLVLGGGAYSYPRHFLKEFPQAVLDVVEIDPQITALAKKYFFLADDPRMTIFHADGRTFLNTNAKKYDVVFGDAFGNYYSVPYQLTTREALRHIYNALSDRGVMVLNVISSLEGETSKFFRAEYRTARSIFPQVYAFPVRSSDPAAIQNIILIGLKESTIPNFTSKEPKLADYLSRRWTKPIVEDLPILTDDFAPVDQYISALL